MVPVVPALCKPHQWAHPGFAILPEEHGDLVVGAGGVCQGGELTWHQDGRCKRLNPSPEGVFPACCDFWNLTQSGESVGRRPCIVGRDLWFVLH